MYPDHLIQIRTNKDRSHYPHLMDGETEAQNGCIASWSHDACLPAAQAPLTVTAAMCWVAPGWTDPSPSPATPTDIHHSFLVLSFPVILKFFVLIPKVLHDQAPVSYLTHLLLLSPHSQPSLPHAPPTPSPPSSPCSCSCLDWNTLPSLSRDLFPHVTLLG